MPLSPPELQAVLFDLDGTLLDTAPDLGDALNAVLTQHGRDSLTDAQIRPFASHGAKGLLCLGFGDDISAAADYPELRQQFLTHYQQHSTVRTALFEGIEMLLSTLEQHQIPWGIVTNKPEWLTWPLLDHFPALARSAITVGGDTLATSKPDPAPLLHAAAQLGVASHAVVYVGDAERDIEAGRRAGMKTVAAYYGYVTDQKRAAEWGEDAAVESPAQLLQLLNLTHSA